MSRSALAFTLALLIFGTAAYGAHRSTSNDLDPLSFKQINVICDLKKTAPEGECRGFIVGVIESELTRRLGAIPEDRLIPLCVKDVPREAIVTRVWSGMREEPLICMGICTADSFVSNELVQDYRCKK
jgi:hypothetical protein